MTWDLSNVINYFLNCPSTHTLLLCTVCMHPIQCPEWIAPNFSKFLPEVGFENSLKLPKFKHNKVYFYLENR